MARILTLSGQIKHGPAAPLPKPKAAELQQGYEVMAYIPTGQGFTGEHLERCKIIERNGRVLTVSWERWAWSTHMQDPNKVAVRKTCYSTINMSKVICIADDYSWHAKILSGSPGGAGKVTGLVKPSALDEAV